MSCKTIKLGENVGILKNNLDLLTLIRSWQTKKLRLKKDIYKLYLIEFSILKLLN